MYKSSRLELRLTEREIEMLDQIRGTISRSAWIRNQILRVHMSIEKPIPRDPDYLPPPARDS